MKLNTSMEMGAGAVLPYNCDQGRSVSLHKRADFEEGAAEENLNYLNVKSKKCESGTRQVEDVFNHVDAILESLSLVADDLDAGGHVERWDKEADLTLEKDSFDADDDVYEPAPEPSPYHDCEVDVLGLRILTINALFSPVHFNKSEGLRMQNLLDLIVTGKYDVVCFQELIEASFFDPDHQVRFNDFVSKMHRSGFCYYVTGPKPRLSRPDVLLDGGCAIFSKFPFVKTDLVHWDEQISWDSWASKGIVHAIVEVPPPREAVVEGATSSHSVRLHILTLHAQASHVGWLDQYGSDAYKRVRIGQMQQIAKTVKNRAADGDAVVVLGDFNFDARNCREREIHQAQFRGGTTGRAEAPVDLIVNTLGCYPATYGDVDEHGAPKEQYLTQKEAFKSMECLDHAYFWRSTKSPACGCCGQIVGNPWVQLEQLEVSEAGVPEMTHVSDHYGWSVHIDMEWQKGATCSCVQVQTPTMLRRPSEEVPETAFKYSPMTTYCAAAMSFLLWPVCSRIMMLSSLLQPFLVCKSKKMIADAAAVPAVKAE